jgi:hypothetical protein
MFCLSAVNNKVTFSCDWNLEQREGYTHLFIKDSVAAIKPSRAYIHMSNLFDGDKLLGKSAISHGYEQPSCVLSVIGAGEVQL